MSKPKMIMCEYVLTGTHDRWPYLLALTAFPCLVSALVLPWLPDSPRYLLVNKNSEPKAAAGMIYFKLWSHLKKLSCCVHWCFPSEARQILPHKFHLSIGAGANINVWGAWTGPFIWLMPVHVYVEQHFAVSCLLLCCQIPDSCFHAPKFSTRQVHKY